MLRDSKANGFSLIELIIVLAIMAILSAILVPNFLSSTDRAKLKSDVQSARVIQNALDLYNTENHDTSLNTSKKVLDKLQGQGYLRKGSVADDPQTTGAKWILVDGRILVDITGADCDPSILDLYDQLSPQEQEMIKEK